MACSRPPPFPSAGRAGADPSNQPLAGGRTRIFATLFPSPPPIRYHSPSADRFPSTHKHSHADPSIAAPRRPRAARRLARPAAGGGAAGRARPAGRHGQGPQGDGRVQAAGRRHGRAVRRRAEGRQPRRHQPRREEPGLRRRGVPLQPGGRGEPHPPVLPRRRPAEPHHRRPPGHVPEVGRQVPRRHGLVHPACGPGPRARGHHGRGEGRQEPRVRGRVQRRARRPGRRRPRPRRRGLPHLHSQPVAAQGHEGNRHRGRARAAPDRLRRRAAPSSATTCTASSSARTAGSTSASATAASTSPPRRGPRSPRRGPGRCSAATRTAPTSKW